MIKEFLEKANLKQHVIPYLFLFAFFSCMYSLIYSIMQSLSSLMLPSVLPYYVGEYIIYIISAYVMFRMHVSMDLMLNKKDEKIKWNYRLLTLIIIYSILFIVMLGSEAIAMLDINFAIKAIFSILSTLAAMLYLPLQILINKSLINKKVVNIKAISKNLNLIFYASLIIDVLCIFIRYLIDKDLYFLRFSASFAMFYNPFQSIITYGVGNNLILIVIGVVSLCLFGAYYAYSMLLLYLGDQAN